MLKNLCFCSGQQHCTTSSASLKINPNIIQNPNCKPSIFISSCQTSKITIERKEHSSSDRSDCGDNFKSSDDSSSLSQSYPSSISNSIHFYHPKSIQSTHFTDMTSRKKSSSITYISSNEASQATVFSSVPSSNNYSDDKGDLENSNEKIKKIILPNRKRSIPLTQQPVILEQEPSEKNSNIQELKLLKKLNSYQFSLLKNKFNKGIKPDIKNEIEEKPRPNRKINVSIEKLKPEMAKLNNVDIYESINLSNNNFDSNTLTISKKYNTKSSSVEISLKNVSDEFQKDSLNVDSKKIESSEMNETSISSDSFNKMVEVSETKIIFKDSVEAVSSLPETYNNNLSGNEITYISNKTVSDRQINEKNKRSEFFIKIDGLNSSKNSYKTEDKSNHLTIIEDIERKKSPKRIKKAETRKRVRIDLKKDLETKLLETSLKQISIDDASKIEENNKTKLITKHRHCCHTHKKAKQVNNPTSVTPSSSPASVSIQKVNLNPTTTASTKIYVNNPSNTYLDDKKIEHTDNRMSAELVERMEKLVSRMENATVKLESCASGSLTNGVKSTAQNGNHDTTEDLPSIVAFDDLISSSFNAFKDLSSKIGGDVKTIIDLVEKALKLERQFLVQAARSVQPSQDIFMKFLQQYSKNIEEVQSFREKNRTSQFFNHLSAISESIGAFGWIAVSPAPSPYVKEMSDAAQFYTNRVLKDYKEKDANHVQWARQWLQFLSELQAYVKQHHTTGVSWNSSKQSGQFDASKVTLSGSTSAPAAPVGGPAPPPPPPVMSLDELLADDGKSKSNQGANTDALFAELSKGSDITKNLKRVADDQKTHKNPNLRAGSTVPSTTNSSTTSSASLNSKSISNIQKPPVFELQDKKWKIEYQVNRSDLKIEDTDLKQTVYIYQCKECTITVKGKVNSIIVDSCNRVGLLFDDVLSTVEFINSKSVQMQVLGKVPTVSIDKTDGCQIYLSRKSLESEIVSSKSSSMNVLIPNERDDEFTEHPVPEQFKTIINPSRKLTTTPTESV